MKEDAIVTSAVLLANYTCQRDGRVVKSFWVENGGEKSEMELEKSPGKSLLYLPERFLDKDEKWEAHIQFCLS